MNDPTPLMNNHPLFTTVFQLTTLNKRPFTNDHLANTTSDHGNLNFTPEERPSDSSLFNLNLAINFHYTRD